MGQWGLYLLTMWEVAPEVVSTTIAEALTLYEAITAEMAAVVVVSVTLVASCKDKRLNVVMLHKYEKGKELYVVTNNLENTSGCLLSKSYDADTQK